MNAYIVNEVSTESKIVLRSWVCMTIEKARECLANRYNLAKNANNIGGLKAPTDCLKYDFFFWDEMNIRYDINKANLYE